MPYTLFGILIMRMNHIVVLIKLEKRDTVVLSISCIKLYDIYKFLRTRHPHVSRLQRENRIRSFVRQLNYATTDVVGSVDIKK